MHSLKLIFLFYSLSSAIVLSAQGQDSLQTELNEVEISAAYTSGLKGISSGHIAWEISSLSQLPQLFGQTDPLRSLQYLPGVQTSSEVDAGLHIEGGESWHNAIQQDHVTIYNPNHLLGIFSVFHSDHFVQMETCYEATPSWTENRLGGIVNVRTHESRDSSHFRLNASVGLLSSQGSMHIVLGSRSDLLVSARKSHLNLLYGEWLQIDDYSFRYDLEDYNLTWNLYPSSRDRIWLNLYHGQDLATLKEDDGDNIAQWGNDVLSLHWTRHFNDYRQWEHTLYTTSSLGRVETTLPNAQLYLPSNISSQGYKTNLTLRNTDIGLHFIRHSFELQHPHNESHSCPKADCREVSIYGDRTFQLLPTVQMNVGMSGSLYCQGDYRHWTVEPSVSVAWQNTDNSRLRLDYGWNHQYLHQTGFSSIGLPSEFWLPASDNFKPQRAHRYSLSHTLLLDEGAWSLSSKLYFKQLWNQCEYSGNLYDMIYHQEDYSLEEHIQRCKGWNYGFHCMLNRCKGALTGWIDYTWGRSRRQRNEDNYIFSSSHERLHELNIVGHCQIGHHWSVSSTYILASGTPFTAPKSLYVINGRILSDFGPYNGNRLPTYQRWDLSGSFKFHDKSRRIAHTINVSLYNVLGTDNALFYRLKFYKGKYGYKPLKLISYPLPSISYHVTI